MAAPQTNSLVVIACPHCGTRYQVSYESIGAKGRTVLCAHCNRSWDAKADPPPKPVAAPKPAPKPAPPPKPTFSDKDLGALAEEMLDQKFVMEEQRHKARHDAAAKRAEDDARAKVKPKTKAEIEEAAIARAAERAAAIANADTPVLSTLPGGDPADDEAGRAEGYQKTIDEIRAAIEPKPAIKVGSASHRKVQKEFFKRQREIYNRLPVARFRRWARIASLASLAAVLGAGILLRGPIVQQFPQLAGAYTAVGLPVNVVGLEFRDVHTLQALQQGTEILAVDGSIASVSGREAPVPPVIVTLLGPNGAPVYQWSTTAQATELEPGETVHFQTQLSKPPHNIGQVRLSFANSRAATRLTDVDTPGGKPEKPGVDAAPASTDDAPQIKIIVPGDTSAAATAPADPGTIQIIDNGASADGQNPAR